jgi:hypothetical protein
MMARAGHMRARAFTTALTAEKMTNLYRDVLAQTINSANVGSRSIKLFGRERSSNIRSAE